MADPTKSPVLTGDADAKSAIARGDLAEEQRDIETEGGLVDPRDDPRGPQRMTPRRGAATDVRTQDRGGRTPVERDQEAEDRGEEAEDEPAKVPPILTLQVRGSKKRVLQTLRNTRRSMQEAYENSPRLTIQTSLIDLAAKQVSDMEVAKDEVITLNIGADLGVGSSAMTCTKEQIRLHQSYKSVADMEAQEEEQVRQAQAEVEEEANADPEAITEKEPVTDPIAADEAAWLAEQEKKLEQGAEKQ